MATVLIVDDSRTSRKYYATYSLSTATRLSVKQETDRPVTKNTSN